MELHAIGIDLGKTVFHLVGLDSSGNVIVRKRCSRDPVTEVHSESAGPKNRDGSLQWISFSGTCSARTGPRRPVDPGAVREALCEDEQERLHRCRSYCRSGTAANDALRADQNRGAVGSADRASSAGALGDAKNRGGQPDSRSPARTRPYLAERPQPRRSGTSGDPNRSRAETGGIVSRAVGSAAARTGAALRTHRTDGCGHPGNGQRERSLPTAHGHPGDRPGNRDSFGRRDRQWQPAFGEGRTWPPGWGWFPESIRPAANRSCSASASGETRICEDYSCKEREL